MVFANNGGAVFTLGGGAQPPSSAPAPVPSNSYTQQQTGGVAGVLKTIVGKIDFSKLFGTSSHEQEHIATISGLYDRAIAGDASAYKELHHRMTAKWVDVYGPGSADPGKWLRPQHERDLAARALASLASSTEFVATVATNPAYAELRKVAQDVRDALATAVGRIGAGATQAAVDKIGGPNGAATGGAVIPLSRSQLLAIAVIGGALLIIALKKRGR